MPADAAMKVAGLLQNAFSCEEAFEYSDATRSYQVKDPAEVEFKLVRANQLRPRERSDEDSAKPLTLPLPMRRLPR